MFSLLTAGYNNRPVKFWRKNHRKIIENLEREFSDCSDNIDEEMACFLKRYKRYNLKSLKNYLEDMVLMRNKLVCKNLVYQGYFLFKGDEHPNYSKSMARISRIEKLGKEKILRLKH